MTEHIALEILSRWTGRPPTQAAFEARGFLVHKSWQKRIMEFCGDKNFSLLNRYWDEVAIETMGSMGQGDPKARWFAVQPKYRSEFLDQLAASVDYSDPKFRNPPLVKGLLEYWRRLNYDAEFRLDDSIYFENLKTLESARLSIDATGWADRKRDAIPFVEKFAGALGFERYRNRYRKKTRSGLVFDVGVDLGGRRDAISLPLIFSLFHVGDPKFCHQISLFDRIVPGFEQYAHGGNPEGFVLGIKAHIELFNILANSFDKSFETA